MGLAYGLVGARTIPVRDQWITLCSIHPVVAEAGRAEENPQLLAAALIRVQTASGRLRSTLHNLALSDLPPRSAGIIVSDRPTVARATAFDTA